MPATALQHFTEDIARARAIVAHADPLPDGDHVRFSSQPVHRRLLAIRQRHIGCATREIRHSVANPFDLQAVHFVGFSQQRPLHAGGCATAIVRGSGYTNRGHYSRAFAENR